METQLFLYGKPFIKFFSLNHAYKVESPMKDDACFFFVQQGRQDIYSPLEKIELADHDSVLMKCGNYIANFAGTSPDAEFKGIVFHLDPELIRRAFGTRLPDFLKPQFARKHNSPAVKIERGFLIRNFVNSIRDYFNNPDAITDELLGLKLQELIIILSDGGKDPVANHILATLNAPEEVKFEQVIFSNLYNRLSIGELAFLTNRSESTFKRDFKKYYGASPAKYIKGKKLEKSAELLAGSQHPVSSIAWQCGFENIAHFSASFTAHFGKSPREYRGMIQLEQTY
jgi:AraC-like DNA-binding protein